MPPYEQDDHKDAEIVEATPPCTCDPVNVTLDIRFLDFHGGVRTLTLADLDPDDAPG
jgi:hypothetical protein